MKLHERIKVKRKELRSHLKTLEEINFQCYELDKLKVELDKLGFSLNYSVYHTTITTTIYIKKISDIQKVVGVLRDRLGEVSKELVVPNSLIFQFSFHKWAGNFNFYITGDSCKLVEIVKGCSTPSKYELQCPEGHKISIDENTFK